MKKVAKFFGILVVLFLALIILVPIMFKDKLVALVQEEANKNLNATVAFEDVSLTMWRSFPDLSLGVKGFKITNIAPFEGTELVNMEEMRFTIDLMSVIKGTQYEIEAVELIGTKVHVIVLEDGKANYDIVPPIEEETPEDTTQAAPFSMALKKYVVDDFNLVYDDRQGKIAVNLEHLDHEGQGDFSDALVSLKTRTDIAALTVNMDGIKYLNKSKWGIDFDVDYEQASGRVSFGQNKVMLNDLGLEFSGDVTIGDPVIGLNIEFNAIESQFKSILSLVPAVYSQDFAGLKASGSLALQGQVRGDYNMEGEDLPAFTCKMVVKDGYFQYPDVPTAVENVGLQMEINHPGGQMDDLVVNIEKFHVEVGNGGGVFDATLMLEHPVTDPLVNTKLMANLDLAKLAQAVPVEGLSYQGKVEGDLQIAGRVSQFEASNAENIQANGSVGVSAFELTNDSLPVPVTIDLMKLNFTPRQVDLESFSMKMGQSDIQATGSIANFVSYAFADAKLKGQFNLQSERLDLNPFMSAEPEQQAETASEEPLAVVAVPTNVDMAINATVGQVNMGEHTLTNLVGGLLVNNGAITMKGVKLEMLGGKVSLDGQYAAPTTEKADVDLQVGLQNFEISKLVGSFETIKTIAPIAEGASGIVGANFSLKTPLLADMSPDMTKLYSKGVLKTNGVTVAPKFMSKVADVLKNDSYKQLSLGNSDLSYEVKEGRVYLDPFDVNVAGTKANISGSTGIDQTLNLDLKSAVPLSNVQATNLLSQLGVAKGGKVDLTAKIEGTFTNPKVSTSLGGIANTAVEAIKEEITKKVEEVKQEVVNKVNEEAQKLLAQAKAKGDQLVAEAEKQAAAIRAEGKKQADALRAEAKKRADQLIAEAKGNFLKEAAAKEAAKKINDEAEKQAKKVEAEANKRADDLVNAAKSERDKLISEAEAKAKIGG